MSTRTLDQLTLQIFEGTVQNIINGFIVERKSRGLSPNTIKYYQNELRYFTDFLDSIGAIRIDEVTANIIRQYLLGLSERRNNGGCHSAYRCIKALLNWFELEFETEGWKNPWKYWTRL